jgi:hypothetical protein
MTDLTAGIIKALYNPPCPPLETGETIVAFIGAFHLKTKQII